MSVSRVDLKPKTSPAGTDNTEAVESFRLASGLLQTGEYEQALPLANESISLDPNWADAYLNRALIYEAMESPDLASSDYERYLELKPDAEDRAEVLAAMEEPYYRAEVDEGSLVAGTVVVLIVVGLLVYEMSTFTLSP